MPERLTQLAYADVARAQANLALIKQWLPAKLWQALPTLLLQVPDADGALNYLERYLRPDELRRDEVLDRTLRYIERNPAALHYLLLVFSYSRFLSETLVQQPELAEWLHRPTRTRSFRGGIERIKSLEDLDEEFARFEASALGESRPIGTTALDIEPARILARFKRREYLRIMLRDVLGLATLADTTLEISQLADLLLRRALRIAEQRLHTLYGAPQFTDSAGRTQAASFIVLSLGKLGAQELNYASDIDLMFLYDYDGQTAGGSQGQITNAEYFVRLAHAVLKLATEITPEGPVFRVDVRLRPQGTEGFIALSIPAALDYYRSRAREWELQMLIKARASAGSEATARHFLHEVHPLIFRPEFNLAAVEAVLNAREEMTRSLAYPRVRGTSGDSADHAATWNVKLTPGGIRDIEFLAQCLQRVHGGSDPWLAAPAAASTLVALQRLHDKGHLSGHDFYRLGAAYQFLRVIEHRLQLRDGLQRHALPSPDATPPGALDRLARRCGIEAPRGKAAEILLARIGQHFFEVREIYHRLILPHRAATPAEPGEISASPSGGVLPRIAREYPATAQAAREAITSGDHFARRGLDRFLTAAAIEPAVLQELEQHPDRLRLAASVFSRSDLAVEMLARNAADIRLLDHLEQPPAVPLALDQHELFPERLLGSLRTECRCRSLQILSRASLACSRPFETFALLTRLSEWALATALPWVATSQSFDQDMPSAPFTVLGLGRLGTNEMDFGSDADLVFVAADDLSPEQREPWRRLTEQYIHTVSSQTREGSIVPVDTRLRPQGSAGDIVVTASALCDYLAAGAKTWEALTWLKARPVAGNLKWGDLVVQRVRQTLVARWSNPEAQKSMTEELNALRIRMEREGTGFKARGEFKHLPGSFYDIEYILGLLTFRHGRVPQPSPMGNVLVQINALRASGALDTTAAKLLRSAAELFRSTDHAHRVITGESANRPPEPALAGRMAVLLHAWEILPAAQAEVLEEQIRAARVDVRRLYQKEFTPGGPPALQ
jgi:glutamate-ammonia-ligase adenylyltransferase